MSKLTEILEYVYYEGTQQAKGYHRSEIISQAAKEIRELYSVDKIEVIMVNMGCGVARATQYAQAIHDKLFPK